MSKSLNLSLSVKVDVNLNMDWENDQFSTSSTRSSFGNGRKGRKDDIDLIDVVNELQNKLVASGHNLNISLPQIVVVGSQSAGKSSVLESFVGREFLPRGKDTVTRRPTIVQMFPTSQEEYVTFSHNPDVKFTDFNKVREEIESETRKHPGPTGFTSDPISLKIYSPRVLKLTVVDLPGLIKNVEDGHAQTSIHEVRGMVLTYIKPEEALILAITPATQDLVTSDALEIAREVDPKRERTIGVLTKLDCLNDGTDVKDILTNSKIYLKKGYVGVVNRSQSEINERKDFQYILQKEQDFFANHPAYKDIKDCNGIPYLKRMLQKTLRGHIKQFLPQVRSDISQKLSEHRRELKNFEIKMGGSIGFDGTWNKQYYFIKLIQSFIEKANIQLMGNSELVDTDKFSAGAIVQYQLATQVHKKLALTLVPDEEQTAFIIINMVGVRSAISVSSTSFDALNRILLKLFKEPMEKCVTCIKQVLDAAITDCAKMLDQYELLKNEIIYLVCQCIDKEAENTIDRLICHIEANMYHINYGHPDLQDIFTECKVLAPPVGPSNIWESARTEDDLTDDISEDNFADPNLPIRTQMKTVLKENENFQKNVEFTSAVMMKILNHIQKQMEDVAIKYIVFFLVKKVLDFVKSGLLPRLLQSSNFESLTEDCDAEFHWKEETETMCKLLQDALEAIKDF